jgi:hypothetical protein
MLFPVLQQIVAGFAFVAGGLSAPAAQFNECPRAVLSCEKSRENNSQYVCAANANQPPEKHRPQYAWTVSAGRITDDATRPNITFDVEGVKAEAVLVMLKVKWTKLPPTCDFSSVLKVSLR